MMRTTDGKLAILDFGLMTEVTDDQKYGMIEAIAHLLNRDYTEIGQDFINLDFIPRGTDTRPIVPALTKVFDVALAGGGAKSINFQELAFDLAQVTFSYPFRIPPYFALVIRAISGENATSVRNDLLVRNLLTIIVVVVSYKTLTLFSSRGHCPGRKSQLRDYRRSVSLHCTSTDDR